MLVVVSAAKRMSIKATARFLILMLFTVHTCNRTKKDEEAFSQKDSVSTNPMGYGIRTMLSIL